jgi:hypothetical protein
MLGQSDLSFQVINLVEHEACGGWVLLPRWSSPSVQFTSV